MFSIKLSVSIQHMFTNNNICKNKNVSLPSRNFFSLNRFDFLLDENLNVFLVEVSGWYTYLSGKLIHF